MTNKPKTLTATRTEEGWVCNRCGVDIFNGCEHLHGEWECNRCGEWTYPFYYDHADGCQWCGSADVSEMYRRTVPTMGVGK